MSMDIEDGKTNPPIETDWSTDAIVARRDKYYSASQRAFVPYRKPLIVKKGRGQYLWDEAGKRYLDMLGMNLCISVGHAHPAVVEAATRQAAELPHCTTMFYHPVPAHFAEELAATMPPGEDWVVHLMNSGAEAADLALLMARSWSGNIDFLALRGGYHGATFGAQSMTGIANFRHEVPLMGGIHHIATPEAYRGAFGDDVEAYLDDLDRTVNGATSGKLAGMIMEPILGYGGIVPLLDGYIEGAAECVRAAGGLVVIDEVQSGFARTGDHFWGFQRSGVTPDIVIMAKGIGNGYPLAAVVARREVAEAMSGKFYFNTYGANPMSCAAGRAVLRVIREERLQENAKKVGVSLLKVLRDLQQGHELIGDVRARGLMLSIELVKDRKSKAPASEETADIFERTREEGLVMSKSGPDRNILRMVPPLCITEDDVPFFAEAIGRSFEGF
jgi:alanine-glyoxylate transaminase/(R)-3-amino-2-methylpropionate-pyruvate transaminase